MLALRGRNGYRIWVFLWIINIIAVLALFFGFIVWIINYKDSEYFLVPSAIIIVLSLIACTVLFRDDDMWNQFQSPAPPLGPPQPQQAPPPPPQQQPMLGVVDDDDWETMIGGSFPDDSRGAGGLRF